MNRKMNRKMRFKAFWQRIRLKYKLSFINERTLEEVWTVKLSQLSVFAIFGAAAFILIFLTSLIIIKTPIRNYLPGYLPIEVREEIIQNALRTDSLERLVAVQSLYLDNISEIINGTKQVDSIQEIDSIAHVDFLYNIPKSEKEEAFVAAFEAEEKYNLSLLNPAPTFAGGLFFQKPVKGVISSKYDTDTRHMGVDLVAAKDSPILSTLDGTVIFTGTDPDYGNVIQVQHPNGFVSIYKHNEHLLKQVGDAVVAGEAIALIGNTGKLSTGLHLHFELWQNGLSVNPAEYIAF